MSSGDGDCLGPLRSRGEELNREDLHDVAESAEEEDVLELVTLREGRG